MAMVNMPAARRHHRSRIGYAFGLLALVGAATMLVVVVRYPAESATRLAEPVPAPEITVVEEDTAPPDDPVSDAGIPDWNAPDRGGLRHDAGVGGDRAVGADQEDAGATGRDPGSGGGDAAAVEAGPARTTSDQQSLSQSLFYSGLLGLAISLAGLGLVGTRRRMW
ncbi:hypothetical protein [Micromonospora sp. DT47]|uniref:hypothetical protein n=1 Tax=Micromonospora sp. DT47 TaxID=3393431 RepID=UPI003CF360EA